jgi:1-deoxy-D-xylulose-5-phosphate synthase
MGGFGSAVLEAVADAGLDLKHFRRVGIPDRFVEHGTRETCLAEAGLDLAGLSSSVETWWALQTPERIRTVRSV